MITISSSAISVAARIGSRGSAAKRFVTVNFSYTKVFMIGENSSCRLSVKGCGIEYSYTR